MSPLNNPIMESLFHRAGRISLRMLLLRAKRDKLLGLNPIDSKNSINSYLGYGLWVIFLIGVAVSISHIVQRAWSKAKGNMIISCGLQINLSQLASYKFTFHLIT